ncbi:hypothetical protein PsYK624_036030 [Phanerochaete sordida]|uniref:F-box domain-containing protein n=1 Tax=Phanerochaete sordida TaxID=48140 RepID=A0A9P3L9V0_9APHY|nr:hypothetical protein PsYK624_036030 [Phanerochaete sordida]
MDANSEKRLEAKRKHNAGIPAVTLTAELLLEIFKIYIALWTSLTDPQLLPDTVEKGMARLAEHFEGRPAPRYLPRHGWSVALTQVCHLWRDVAISEPTLWSKIPVTAFAGFPTFFQRSSPITALSVRGCMYPRDACVLRTHWARVLERSADIVELSIDIDGQDAAPFDDIPDAAFAELRGLRLVSQRFGQVALPAFAQGNNRFPSLRVLSTALFAFPAVAPLFASSLHAVDIHCSSRAGPNRAQTFPWTMLLTALRNLQQVKYLSLKDVYPAGLPPVATDALAHIDLSYLQSLRLDGYGVATAQLLNTMVFPSNTKINLCLTEDSHVPINLQRLADVYRGDRDIQTVVSLLAERFEGSDTFAPIPGLRSVWLGCCDESEDEDFAVICGWSNAKEPAPPPVDAWFTLHPDMQLSSTSYTFSVFLQHLAALSLLSGVERLVVASDRWRVKQDPWIGLSRSLRHVRELVVRSSCVCTLGAAIVQAALGGDILFPELKILALSNIRTSDGTASGSDEYPSGWLVMFARALGHRAQLGAPPLESVIVEEAYNFDARNHQSLRSVLIEAGVAKDVEWDGVVQRWVPEHFMTKSFFDF